MKSFQEFLTEMSYQDAVEVLGLGKSYSIQDLKAAYKKAALIHHPDKGGDLDMMKKVNAAFDLLSGDAMSNNAPADREAERSDRMNKTKVRASAVMHALAAAFHAVAFQNHFKDIFGESFGATFNNTRLDKMTGYEAGISFSAEFSNDSKTTVLSINVYVDLTQLGGLSSSSDDLKTTVSTTILHARRKLKLAAQNYSFHNSLSTLRNPEVLFPTAKLQKAKATQVDRKMSRRDVFLIFQKELGAEVSSDQVSIPLQDGLRFVIWRTVIMTHAAWGVLGVYEKYKKIHDFKPVYFDEETSTINWLVDHLRHIQTLPSQKFIIQALDSMMEQYKAQRIEKLAKIGA